MQKFKTIADLPESGLILEGAFLTNGDDIGVLPISRATWIRGTRLGNFPRPVKLMSRNAYHSEHIRAIALGQDWREVKIAQAA